MFRERLRHLLSETVLNFRRGGWGVVTSVGAITIAFLITGIFLLLTLNLRAVVDRWGEDFQVVIFLRDDITKEQEALIRKRLDGEMAVHDVTYVSKTEALDKFRREAGGQESLLEGMKTNPLPASFELRIRETYQTVGALRQLATSLTRMEGVEDVLYGQEWVERLTSVIEVMKILGIVFGGVLGLASLFIIANTIRMAVYARAQEIEIMRLVGATRTYIQIPLILEGTAQGGLGAALALGVLYLLFRATLWQLGTSTSILFSGPAPAQFLATQYRVAMIGVGVLMGGVGSLVAVRRFLKV